MAVTLEAHIAIITEILTYLLHPTPLATAPPNTLLLNAQNMAGNTPLHWAALNGHLEAVKLLVNAGADMGMKNQAGKDALAEAELGEKEEVGLWLMGKMENVKRPEGGKDAGGDEQEMDIGGKDDGEGFCEEEHEEQATTSTEDLG